MKRLSLALSLAVSMWACGGSTPTTPMAVVAPTRPTFTISGVISAVTPTGLKTATTDKNGFYSVPGLYPGKNNFIWAANDGFEDPFPAHYPENSEGGRAITIDGDSRFDIQLVRR